MPPRSIKNHVIKMAILYHSILKYDTIPDVKYSERRCKIPPDAEKEKQKRQAGDAGTHHGQRQRREIRIMKENVTLKEILSGIRILTASIGVIAFVAIAWAVIAGKTTAFDDVVRYAFYDVRSDGLTVIAKAITFLGNWQSIVILCLILLIAKPTRVKYGIPVSAGALFVTVLNRLSFTAASASPTRWMPSPEVMSTSTVTGTASIPIHFALKIFISIQ